MPSAQVESRCNWVDSTRAWWKRPARMNCSILGNWRARDSSIAMMWSVISSAQKKGALETTMPFSVAVATAILSVPLPRREIRRQRSSDATTAAGKPVETTATASQPDRWRMSSCGSSSSTYSGAMPNLAYSDRSNSLAGYMVALRRTKRKGDVRSDAMTLNRSPSHFHHVPRPVHRPAEGAFYLGDALGGLFFRIEGRGLVVDYQAFGTGLGGHAPGI